MILIIQFFLCTLNFAYSYNISDSQFTSLQVSIKWPSGIIVRPVIDLYGGVLRTCKLDYSAIQVRPDWQVISLYCYLWAIIDYL